MPYQFITPRLNAGLWRGQFDLPLPPDSVALVRGLLLSLTKPEVWEQLTGITISVEDAVTMAESILASFRSRAVYIGQIIQIAGTVTNDDIVPCDGRELAQVDYPELYEIVGDVWGSAGAGLFRIPDMRARVTVGAGNGKNIGDVGGAETVSLAVSDLPSHNHSIHTHLEGVALTPGELPVTLPNLITGYTGDTGTGAAHENMPPFAVLQFYIIAR